MQYTFKHLKTDEEIQNMLGNDYDEWVAHMKQAGAMGA